MATAKTTTKGKTTAGTRVKREKPVRDQIRDLMNQRNKATLEVSVLLKDVYFKEQWKEWKDDEGAPYADYADYAEKELGINYRTAMELKDVGEIIIKQGFKIDDLLEVGYRKSVEVFRLFNEEGVTKEDVENVFNQTKDMSVRDVKGFVKDTRSKLHTEGGTQERIQITTLKFTFTNEQAEIVNSTMVEFAEKYDIDINSKFGPSRIIEAICVEAGLNMREDKVDLTEFDEEAIDPKTTRKKRAEAGSEK